MFNDAFNFTMQYEVGTWFNPADQETIKGLHATPAQCKKTGYVNDPLDHGGETKFGVSQKNRATLVSTLTLQGAMDIYKREYWEPGQCDVLPEKLQLAHFDTCVLHGVRTSSKLLQRALEVRDDGDIGPETLEKLKEFDEKDILKRFLSERTVRYYFIVKNDESQRRYLKGWLARVDNIAQVLK